MVQLVVRCSISDSHLTNMLNDRCILMYLAFSPANRLLYLNFLAVLAMITQRFQSCCAESNRPYIN